MDEDCSNIVLKNKNRKNKDKTKFFSIFVFPIKSKIQQSFGYYNIGVWGSLKVEGEIK